MVTTEQRIRHYLLSGKALPYPGSCVPNKAMLTGKELGDALKVAIEKKRVTKKAVADHFGVKPPSVQDWIKFGRIGKQHLNELVDFFADVVPPEHWGMRGIDVVFTDGEGRLTAVQAKSRYGASPNDLGVSPSATLSVIEMSERIATQIVTLTRAGLLEKNAIEELERVMLRFVAAARPTTENDAAGRLSDLDAPERNAQHGRRGHGRKRQQ